MSSFPWIMVASGSLLLFIWVYISDYFDLSPALRMGVQMMGTVSFVLYVRFQRDNLHNERLILQKAAPPLTGLSYISGTAKERTPVKFQIADDTRAYVIIFWATWCKVCRNAVPTINSLVRRFRKKGARFVVISNEPESTLRCYTKQIELLSSVSTSRSAAPFLCPLAFAPSEVATSYGLKSIPWAFVVHKGIVTWSGEPHSPELANAIENIYGWISNPRVGSNNGA